MTSTAQRNFVEQLPQELQLAQRAIGLPEVQDLIRRLSAYNLGVCMPHMHDETGAFQVLPHGVSQIEDGLQVSFAATGEIEADGDRFVPVGWFWEADADTDDAGRLSTVQACVKQGTMHTTIDDGGLGAASRASGRVKIAQACVMQGTLHTT